MKDNPLQQYFKPLQVIRGECSTGKRWTETGRDKLQSSTHSKNQQFLSSFAAKPALLGWFCVQTHLYLLSSRNSCTDFRELWSTPAFFVSREVFLIVPNLMWLIKLFAVIRRQLLIFQRSQRQRGFKQYLTQTEQKNPLQNTDDVILLISPLFFFLKINNLNDSSWKC